jgi:transposase
MAAYVLGLDVHSAQSTFVLQREDGTLVDRGSIPTTPEGLRSLRDRHELPPESPVGLETGTVSFYVARQLARLGLRPVVVDAHEVRLKAHRPLQKSDRRDALEICEGVRRGIYRTIVHVPPRAVAVLRDSLSRRRHFVRRQTAETNAVKRLLRAAGLYRYAQRSLLTEKAWDRLEAQIGSDEDLVRYVRQHREAWRCAGRQVSELDAMLVEQQAPFRDQVRRLQTVPGVGPIVA